MFEKLKISLRKELNIIIDEINKTLEEGNSKRKPKKTNSLQ